MAKKKGAKRGEREREGTEKPATRGNVFSCFALFTLTGNSLHPKQWGLYYEKHPPPRGWEKTNKTACYPCF